MELLHARTITARRVSEGLGSQRRWVVSAILALPAPRSLEQTNGHQHDSSLTEVHRQPACKKVMEGGDPWLCQFKKQLSSQVSASLTSPWNLLVPFFDLRLGSDDIAHCSPLRKVHCPRSEDGRIPYSVEDVCSEGLWRRDIDPHTRKRAMLTSDFRFIYIVSKRAKLYGDSTLGEGHEERDGDAIGARERSQPGRTVEFTRSQGTTISLFWSERTKLHMIFRYATYMIIVTL